MVQRVEEHRIKSQTKHNFFFIYGRTREGGIIPHRPSRRWTRVTISSGKPIWDQEIGDWNEDWFKIQWNCKRLLARQAEVQFFIKKIQFSCIYLLEVVLENKTKYNLGWEYEFIATVPTRPKKQGRNSNCSQKKITTLNMITLEVYLARKGKMIIVSIYFPQQIKWGRKKWEIS